MTEIIDGKKLADELCLEVQERVSQYERPPCLAVILVGDNPASRIYINKKEAAAKKVGIKTRTILRPESTTEDDLFFDVVDLNNDPTVDGILVQLPLPSHINRDRIINSVTPSKDVDGFHPINAANVAAGLSGRHFFTPCTPKAVMRLLDKADIDLTGTKALMIGFSPIVGRPTAMLMTHAGATVTIAHSKTQNLWRECMGADVIVSAAGCPNLVRGEFIRSGVTIIDVGINRLPSGKIVGDVAFDECVGVAHAITPVPGGVGPMTIACLMENTVNAAGFR